MRYSGIGGQAVMEGVMMKNQDTYAVAVRTANQEIVVDTKNYKGVLPNPAVRKIPILRGVVSFIDSLVLGMKTLTYSAGFFEDEEDNKEKQPVDEEKKKKQDDLLMSCTVVFSIVLAIVIFMILPYGLSQLFLKAGWSQTAVSVAEGILRVAIFFLYMIGISLMKDIQRVYMYHGAEHKCINCIEHGLDLTVENVRNSSRQHKRCGTSFMFLVIIISVIFFIFIRTSSPVMRVVVRLVLIPVIAGVAYEFIRLAGKSDHPVVNFISKPGMLLQKMTTREPDDAMIEVGIASVEAVFDWKSYVAEIRGESPAAKGGTV